MYIEKMIFDKAGKKTPIDFLVSKKILPKNVALIFQRLMGVSYVNRDDFSTHENQLVRMLSKFFSTHHFNKKNIKYCIYAHTADDVFPKASAYFEAILKKYGLQSVLFFGVSLHKCASIFQLMVLSNDLMQHFSSEDRILLLGSDLCFTEILQYIPGTTVLSDGAFLLCLQKNGIEHKIIDVLVQEHGEFSVCAQENLLFQDSYVENLCAVIKTLLSKNNLYLSKIAWIFPHNVNTLSWHKISDALPISSSTIYLDNILENGHRFGMDPFFNLDCALRENKLHRGDYYLLVTVGLGATFSAMLMQY